MSNFKAERLLHAVNTRKRVVKDIMRRRNVVACGVGYKNQGDGETEEPSVVVSVTRKEPAASLSPQDLIPSSIDSVPTDVVETGDIVAWGVNRQVRIRPVQPGISIGHQNGGSGTIGCVVKRGGQYYIVSNNHVLALVNEAQVGDGILQPSPGDGGSLLDQIAPLATFIPIRFAEDTGTDLKPQSEERPGCAEMLMKLLRGATAQPTPPLPNDKENTVDVALAGPVPAGELSPYIVDIGGPPLGIGIPALGMRVIKSGRTTGLTQGTITQIDVTVNVKYGGRTARFADQIMVTPFSQPGDSGSLVLDYERNAIGLLFSGSDQVAVVNPIQAVLSALQVELITENS